MKSIPALLSRFVRRIPENGDRSKGWVRTKRGNKQIAFIKLWTMDQPFTHPKLSRNWLSSTKSWWRQWIQSPCIPRHKGTPRSISGSGQLWKSASEIILIWVERMKHFPLQKKRTFDGILRENAHLRPRTNTFERFSASVITWHSRFKVFQWSWILLFHSPIVTGSDAEGWRNRWVTTLDLNNIPRAEDGLINYKEDFWQGQSDCVRTTRRRVGSAMALGNVYIRSGLSVRRIQYPRHLAEFWMIEPEMAFYDIHDNMDLAEDFWNTFIQYALDNCKTILNFNNMYDKELVSRLQFCCGQPSNGLTHGGHWRWLKSAKIWVSCVGELICRRSMKNFLVEHFKRPVILTDYPKQIKAVFNYETKRRWQNCTCDGCFVSVDWWNYWWFTAWRKSRCVVWPNPWIAYSEKELWWYSTRKYGSPWAFRDLVWDLRRLMLLWREWRIYVMWFPFRGRQKMLTFE